MSDTAARASEPVELDENQALFFRARRSHLAGRGATDPESAARAILGAQAQQENPGLFALSQRTAARPTAKELRRRLLEPGARSLVRTWGQRDTLHIYSSDDWPLVIAALPEWYRSGRRGGMPRESDLDLARDAFEVAEEVVYRRELFDLIPQRYLEEIAAHPGVGDSAERLAATRLIWVLARQGVVCFAHKTGAEQAYVHRGRWLPRLEWSEPPSHEAATALARRYLATFAPATAADMAHFFGSRVTAARSWLDELRPELVDVACGGRRGLMVLAADLPSLRQPAPRVGKAWPVRLLPQWDMHTMTHKDKSWVVPRDDEAKQVWRKAGVNAATVLARGRFVATWSYRATTRLVVVTVSPMSGWRKSYLAPVKREAAALAAHLERDEVEVTIE